MNFKKNIKMYSIAIILTIALLLTYFVNSKEEVYGNNQESIVQVIKSIEGYESDEVEILEIKDIQDDRLVGFLINNNPAYIHFTKNQKGNYEWKHAEKNENLSFAPFLIKVPNDLKFMIVTNQENQVAKLELGVNEHIIEQEFRVNEKSVTWIDMPKDKNQTYTYKYFDKDGNSIKDY